MRQGMSKKCHGAGRGNKMKKVLVAGATGYLGKYLVQELAEKNYEVSGFVGNNGREIVCTGSDPAGNE